MMSEPGFRRILGIERKCRFIDFLRFVEITDM